MTRHDAGLRERRHPSDARLRARAKWLAWVLLAIGATTLAGCFNPFDPLVFREGGTASTAPSPTSPENTLRLLQWCWTNRAPDLYEEIFTDDYEFVFGATDSTGQAYRDGILHREDEIISFRNLCNGGGSEPPATSISLTFDPTLRKNLDSRPGHRNKWHWTILTTVALTVRTESQSYETQGRGLYFFVRGDSAAIPPALAQRGFLPDSTRWWVDRWEDQTVSTGGGLLATALAKAGSERIVSVNMRITPAGEWERDTPLPAASPGGAAARAAVPGAGDAVSLSDPRQVSFGYIKHLFRQRP